MSKALCLNCGAVKFGAMVPCPECNFRMMGSIESMQDANLAITFSEHHFEVETLEEFGKVIKAINQVCDDRELARWCFIKYVSRNHPEILELRLPPYLSAKTFQVLQNLDLPGVTLREGPDRRASSDTEDEGEGTPDREQPGILEPDVEAGNQQQENLEAVPGREAVTRIAEISVALTVAEGVELSFADRLEVSLDCPTCERNHRTVVFRPGAPTGVCTPVEKCGSFPGRIIDKRTNRAGNIFSVVFEIEYEYRPFVDRKYGNESTGIPQWGRVYFDVTCPKCSRSSERGTQNNIVRPWSCHCKCGQLLYPETEEMPKFRCWDKGDA